MAKVENVVINVTGNIEIDTMCPGCGVIITKRPDGGKSTSLTLSRDEFRKLHRAMAALEPFVQRAEDVKKSK